MKNEILVAMASDMKITKYESESDAQYTQRVLYSALACWIKAATLDRDISKPASVGTSKKHIKKRKVLHKSNKCNTFLSFCCSTRFY